MASQVPAKKNTAFTLYFTLYKNDGTVIANPGTITKKISIDGAAVADISASVTEEDTTYGQCSIALSSSEMNGDAIWIYIKDDTSGCVPFTTTIYTAANTQDGIESKIDTIDTNVDSILVDTGTTLDTLVKDIPTTAEFEARTLPAADYVVVSDLPASLDAAGVRGAVGLATANLDTQLSALPTAAENADAVWDESLAAHLSAGSTGAGLNAAGSAGDPWSTPLPGAYGSGTAGKIIGDNVNATISSRSTLTAQQVWEYATRTLSSFGTLVSNIWSNATRTLSEKTGFSLTADYDSAKTAAQAGSKMDLINAPNATAITAIQSGLALDSTVAKDATVMKAAAYVEPDNAGIAALPTLTEIEASTVLAKEATLAGGVPLSATAVDAILDEVVDGTVTTRQALRVMLSLLGAKCSGGGTATLVFRDIGDTKARVTMTVDESGNRSAVVLDLA